MRVASYIVLSLIKRMQLEKERSKMIDLFFHLGKNIIKSIKHKRNTEYIGSEVMNYIPRVNRKLKH